MSGSESERAGTEVELKLTFDPADASRILSHPVLTASDASRETRDLISIYYDTGDDVLRQAGVFLRVRATGNGYVQTIKTARDETQFLERREWEQKVPTHEPDLDAAEGTALAPLLTPEVRANLRPRFHTRVRRQTFQMRRDGAEIELAIDQGEITAGVTGTPVSELELELKAGDKRELFRLAGELAETIPLNLNVKTKAERGFELVDGGDHAVEKAGSIAISPDMAVAEAFRTIARNCLRQIVVNAPAVRDENPEALHQMRIGLRRLRAGIALFADVVDDEVRARIGEELKWITQELGPARDLDVFAADVLEPLRAARPGDAEVAAAHREFAARRDAAYARAAGAVGSQRFRLVLVDIIGWIEVGHWAESDRAGASVAEHAAKELRRLRRQVKKRGANLRDLSAGERHRLRIRAKRLRYATEFFAATFPGKENDERREKSLSALKDLQGALGALNDIATRHIVLGEDKAPVRLETHTAEAEKRLEESERAYARFAKVKAFWKA
ncbi:MAG: CHAD domain-containing protein [Methyloceanibacter sp.]|uniref:CYTH and CHAD domain-containing protein n=1 Tax=Methyloceanibacter sp. TaxID=1965321 RepID=UPI003D6D886F